MTVRGRELSLPWTVLAVGLVSMLIASQLLNNYHTGLLIEVLIFGIFAMSLNLLLGYTGLPSLGHAAFFGAAGYATANIMLKVTDNFWLAAPFGILIAALIAVPFALFALRAKGAYFLMITLALAQVLWAIAFKWREVTGGDDGLPGVTRPDLGFVSWNLWDAGNYLYFAMVVFVLAAFAMQVVVKSPFGLALQGIRENEGRMRSLGYNVWLYKFAAFVAAGFFAGVAGVLFVYYNGFVSTTEVSVVLSAEVFLMVVLGGSGTLLGPAFGAAAVVLLRNIISSYTAHWLLILGIIYVGVVMFAPNGIVQGVMDAFRRITQRGSSVDASTKS